MDTSQDINTVEWFFGYGGNHLGLKRVLPNLRLLAACEIEEFAVENILAKMEAGLLEAAPIWSDCKTFPWEPFVDRTHLFVASYPCQPFSAAGKRQGTEDERHLWPYVYRWILRARPLLVFLENVEGHVSLGLSTVISDLEEGGYKATWGIFSASEVGAPHQRKRVFILAYRHGERGQLPDWWRVTAEQVPVGHGETWRDDTMANAASAGYSADAASICGSEGEARRQDVFEFEHCGATPWPSRPGEQQFAWEPPRVVADTLRKQSQRGRDLGELGSPASAEQGEAQQWERSGNSVSDQGEAETLVDAKSQRAGQRSELRSEECGSRSALSWDVEQSGEGAMANANELRLEEHGLQHTGVSVGSGRGQDAEAALANNHGPHAGHGEQRPERTLGDLSGGCGEAMGHTASHRGEMRQDIHAGNDGQGSVEGRAAMGNAASEGPQERSSRSHDSPIQAAQCGSGGEGNREAESSLGRDADGPADWLDHAELYTTCDNRTDELRLLGNGVVPACAERAFRLLVGELMEQQP